MSDISFESDILYKVIYELTFVFESSKTPDELILGLKQVFKRFFCADDTEIYTYNIQTSSLRNFVKPWENLPNGKFGDELIKIYNSFKNDNVMFAESGESFYFSLNDPQSSGGVVRISGNIKKEILKQLLPILCRQLSLAVVHLNYFESVQNSAKFYETIRNIAKITETQYDLSYILPIMGEMIDGFIRDHLIYVFLKNPRKKEYKLIWPNKCLINNIGEYLSNIKDSSHLIFDGGKTCIFPLMSQGKPAGAIVAYNPLDVLNDNEIKYLEQLSIQASITVNKAKEYMKILQNATLDALTGLNNRAMFYQRLNEATSNARRQKTPLCCIMTDIDFFKSVNDTYGHAAGDIVLKTTANTLKKELREYDTASRYGGEEFAILLPDTPLEEAYNVALRLKDKVGKKKINIGEFNADGKKEISVTISIGVALYDPSVMKEAEELYKMADKGLYIAKESGRNRVAIFDR